jgi:hypothetical protein
VIRSDSEKRIVRKPAREGLEPGQFSKSHPFPRGPGLRYKVSLLTKLKGDDSHAGIAAAESTVCGLSHSQDQDPKRPTATG